MSRLKIIFAACRFLTEDKLCSCFVTEGTFEDRKMCHQRNCTNCKNTLRGGFCWCEEGFQVNENTDNCEGMCSAPHEPVS